MKKIITKSGLAIVIILCLLHITTAQNVGIGTNDPTAKLHLKPSASNDPLLYTGFENSNSSPLVQVGNWSFTPNVVYDGAISAVNGYQPTGTKSLSYTLTVQPEQIAKLTYAYKDDVSPSGELTLPFEQPILGNGSGSPWLTKSHLIPPGQWTLIWSVEYVGTPGATVAGLLYLDEVKIELFEGEVLRIEDGNEGEGKVLKSDSFGNAQWSSNSVVSDEDGDTKVDVEQSEDDDIVRLISAGNEVMTITPESKVGIGTQNPESKVDIQGPSDQTLGLLRANVNYTGFSDVIAIEGRSVTSPGWGIGGEFTGGYYGVRAIGDGQSYTGSAYGVYAAATGSGGTRFGIRAEASGGTTNWAGYFGAGDVYISNDLRIGTSEDPYGGIYKVIVDGKVISEEVRIQNSTDWPDYVFDDGYNLLSLSEIEKHISSFRHLPGVPSAEEVDRDGILLGDMQKILMEKIEELTLYVIDQQKEIDSLKAKMEKNEK